MTKLFDKISRKAGLPPGSLVHVGETHSNQVAAYLFRYNKNEFYENKEIDFNSETLFKTGEISWINIDGVHQSNFMEKVKQVFDLHPLIIEDIMNTDQRVKVERYEDKLFIVIKMFYYDQNEEEIVAEQLSFILGKDYLLSFQENEGDVFDRVRERLRVAQNRIRRSNADYLFYSLVDAIVDNYLIIVEEMAEQIDILEEEILKEPSRERLEEIYEYKSQMIELHRHINPLQSVINYLTNDGSTLISNNTTVYLRDVYDHIVRLLETIVSEREILNGMLDMFVSLSSYHMNQVMKILTIIATIFMPLTLIAGIYGMNFRVMPELEWPWGYPLVLLVMLVVAIIMVIYFKRKKML